MSGDSDWCGLPLADRKRRRAISVSIRLSNVSVRYQALQSRTKLPSLARREMVEVDALRDVSFELLNGDALGIVGHNGAGKSSLIKVISGAVVPSSGTIEVTAQPQRLNVSWALQPPLSGRRNIYLGLLAQGHTPAAARSLIPEVVDATGLGSSIDRPMNTFSSGMKARLGFAVATVQTPEILLLDEALAVGDKTFRARSLRRVNTIRRQAGTVVLATHNLAEIEETCNITLWLDQGQVVAIGHTEDVLSAYRRSGSMSLPENMARMERHKRQRIRRERDA